ncbi:MAG: c-type cytochrome [Gemmataceae bacterium]
MRFYWLPALLVGTGLALAVAPPAKRDEIPEFIRGAQGLDDALRNLKAKMATTPVVPPEQALAGMKTRKGLVVDLLGHEPTVKQPLYLSFDERGRMWVVQYRQYPFPAGLRVVAYDRYIRAKFDRVPPPPPNHFRGVDRVTIHEDVRGDGSYSKVKTFVDELNIATAALPGRGGVWVLNPPYLLFYPDPDRTDVAGRPVVHLSGFGLEDTHSVASSLCWGPDGWLYGAHGSTVTAKVKVEITGSKTTTDFLGQAIWRYHPEEHRFEVFAEGGGNTFGVAFDDVGRVYSGTNWGTYRGLHYVQGGYYIKGWGKHGPLTNPYALGFFQHMPHVGNADRLVHTFIVYGGGVIPELEGRIVGVNALQKRVQVTRLLKDHSTFRTEEEPFLLWTEDERFRPVDVKAGPDGAVYVADLYEPRINHVDPRDNWDRATGRLYRVRPANYSPAPRLDLAKKSSQELVSLLGHKNRWYRDMARRVLGDRRDRTILPELKSLLEKDDGHLALEALWALQVSGGLDDQAIQLGLRHANPHVRRWTIRLVGDRGTVTPGQVERLAELARMEKDAEVRSQLASTAKRLAGPVTLALVRGLVQHDEDMQDPHIPLLVWWTLESKAESHRDDILRLLGDGSLWAQRMVEQVLLERLMQRWAMAGGKDNLTACARLLGLAPTPKLANRLLTGLEKGFAGRAAENVPQALSEAVARVWASGGSEANLALGLRLNHPPSVNRALLVVADEKVDRQLRLSCIRILGEVDQPRSVEPLLTALRNSQMAAIRQESLQALMRYPEARIGEAVLALRPESLPEAEGVRGAAYSLLASRPVWVRQLLAQIEGGKTSPRTVPLDVVQKLALQTDPEIRRLVNKHWGRVRATPQEKQKEILRIAELLKKGRGDPAAGKTVYANTCARCHKLFGQGGEVGPELTGYERSNSLYWMENIIDPSAAIREEYMTFIIQMDDGRLLTGIVAGQDKTTVTLKDPEGKLIRLNRARIEDMRASPISLMPEDQLKTLKEQQVRDLFAYLMTKTPPR